MKKPLMTVFIIGIFSFSYSQEKEKIDTIRFVCIYNLIFQQDSTDQYLQEEPMILYIGKNNSKFFSYNTVLRNKAVENMEIPSNMDSHSFNELIAAQKKAAPNPNFRFKVYKDHIEKNITTTEYVIPDYYLYSEPMGNMAWEFTEDKVRIMHEFNVHRATTEFGGRTWEAWFTTEIPIGEGPYKFNGLPGLIVKISDTAGHYSFNLTSLEIQNEDEHIYFEKNPYIKTSKKQFFKIKSNFYNNILIEASQASFNASQQQRISENVKKRNNPIELIID